MGFRGEALASIAAVAQVELKTRQESDEIGNLVAISGSRYERQELLCLSCGHQLFREQYLLQCSCPPEVLKSNSTELKNILTAFERIALVNLQISFTLHSNGTEVFNLRAANLRQRILDVFGKKFNHRSLACQCRDNNVQGFRICRQTGGCPQEGSASVLLCERQIHEASLFQQGGDGGLPPASIPLGEQVPYFLYFEVDPEGYRCEHPSYQDRNQV